jgi:hypothetical protein
MKKINTFWNWFQDNNQRIKNVINENSENQKHITFWISKNLSYYCKEIDFMIVYPKNSNEKTEFIITANGNPNFFQQVVNLIDNAPQLRTWKFTAFIQPTERIDEMINDRDDPYIFQEFTLKASELKFLPLQFQEESNKLDIIVYLKNYNLYCHTKTLQQAIFVILQDLVGEKSVYQNINLVQLAQEKEEQEGVIKLYDLQKYLDANT